MKVTLKDILQLLVFSSIGIFILWTLWQSQQEAYLEECINMGIPSDECNLLDKLVSDLKASNFFWLIMVCVVFMLGNVCRALRWHQVLEPLDIRPKFYNSFFTVMAAYFINLGIPRSGEFARAGLFAKYEKAPFDKVFGTVVMGRVIDVICLLIMILLGFIFSFDELWGYIKNNLDFDKYASLLTWGIPTLVVLGVIGLYVLYLLFKTKRLDNVPFISKIKKFILGLWEGLKSVKDVKNVPLFILYTIGIWLSYYLMNYFMFFALEATSHLNPSQALLVFDFGALGMVFPSPGGMGAYHAMIMQALDIFNVSSVNAFSFAMILFFVVNLFCNVAFGLCGLLLLPILNSKRDSTDR